VELLGAVLATFLRFLPSFVFVIGGTHYIEKVRDNRSIQAFLAGVSAAVVGVIAVVSLDLIPEAIIGWPSVAIAVIAFLLIVWLKRDVALVAVARWPAELLFTLYERLLAEWGTILDAKEGYWRPPMKWVTREQIRVNRTATCWLIRRFLDPKAEFLFVAANEVASMQEETGGTGFDAPEATYPHQNTQGALLVCGHWCVSDWRLLLS